MESNMTHTIRGRIVIVFVACLVFVAVLTAFYYWNILSIERRLAIVENFGDLFNDILEIRRYEKNFIFYKDKDSLNETISYIDKTEQLTAELADDIANVAGQGEFEKFRGNLVSYRGMMEEHLSRIGSVTGEIEAGKIREKGKELVDFAQELLRMKRQRIHQALTRTLSIPVAFVASFLLLLMLIFQLVVRNILKPLALIQRTTGEVARGNYTPIPYEARRKDEISELIAAFNKMAGEIESRQEELVQSRKIASIGTFTSGIAHELNNPLNNIYLTAETLLEDHATLSDAETRELILDVLNQADRAGEIVKNLLDFSRSERPSFADVSIAEVIDSTVKLVKNQIMVAGITLDRQIPGDVPAIRGNLRNLQHVFLNLLLNAIQAMPGGGSIAIQASRDSGNYVRVDVKDTGIGIKPEDLEHIFDPFFTTKGVGRGTGLGLSVTYSIVKKHGGYIEVKSEVNVGTIFSVFLPVGGQQVQSGS
jgi:two-component system NtrC family sensor kinase